MHHLGQYTEAAFRHFVRGHLIASVIALSVDLTVFDCDFQFRSEFTARCNIAVSV